MTPRTVLYADDDPEFADVVGLRLRSHLDCAVETTTSGEHALERLDDADVDCLVLDYRLPGHDPLELLRDARSRRPDVPVVFFTGVDDPSAAADAKEAGAAAFVRKGPGSVDTLADVIREQIGA
ncbi:htr-like protein [Halarchaeum acidiphilum MH1-52-1]|uniref:Htr-like protein n=1 Tax=Halarchaeum acidiphilum MH1-52-1 TaxID=1261545 RepID=U2YRI9_9EURY|nr:response regulator [Halarchaeum acidiphilum]GAD51615.1 htr-like protein [Halarchaeum acidiphilum MH1-52-1]